VAQTRVDPDRLLALALADPARALSQARAVLATRPDPILASAAHQAAGVVLRHYGAIGEAIRELRSAQRWALRAGDTQRATDAASSLGVALALAGRSRAALTALDGAVDAGGGSIARGRVLIRRANVYWMLGRYQEGLEDARRAVRLLRTDEALWQARAVNHRAMLYLALGAVAQADRDYARSEELFSASGQQGEYAYARMERGLAAQAQGDLPRALTLLDQAQDMFTVLDVFEPDLAVSRSAVLLAAGLPRDALHTSEMALTQLADQRGAAASRAALTHLAAQAAMADGDLGTAGRRAQEALRYYQRQNHPHSADRARLVLLQTRVRSGLVRASDLARAVDLATRLDGYDPGEAARAHLLAGQLALDLGRTALGHAQLRAADPRKHRSTSARVTGWLARATLHADRREGAALLRACDAGLRVLDTHLDTLGATELRSVATAEGGALATMALRHALDRHRADLVLTWSERWRAVALAVTPVRPAGDEALTADLAALRLVTRRLAEADSPRLRRERRRLEDAVRGRALRRSAEGGPRTATARGREVVATVRDAAEPVDLVELTSVEDVLYAVHVHGGRARLYQVGPAAAAARELEFMLFLLRRQASRGGRIHQDLDVLGKRLQRALLGEVAERLTAHDVVVVPTGSLHAVPWSTMPVMRRRAVVVAPSATAWMRARAAVPPSSRRIVLVGGPGLGGADEEIAALAARYPHACVLTGASATVEAVKRQMDGAWLVHLAAHGTFRADSPLFSAVELADGPLTGYDLEQLHRSPHRVVLSSCSSGALIPPP